MKKNGITILKFGETSMGTYESINKCCEVVQERIKQKKLPFVVVSAISKMTDILTELLNLAKNKKKKELSKEFQKIKDRHFDMLNKLTKNEELKIRYTKILNSKFTSLFEILSGILLTSDYSDKMEANILSYGEDLSSDIMELALIEKNISSKKINSKYLVKASGDYLAANVDLQKTKTAFKKLTKDIKNGTVFVMTGSFCGGKANEIMLLGKNSSDFSGSIAGIGLDAEIVEIWTDTNGVMSADPKIIKNAISWDRLNKDIASEMARAGAKILNPKAICASYYNIDIIIKNLFNKDFSGTLVNSDSCKDGPMGVISDDNYSMMHFENQDMFDNSGFIGKLGTIADNHNMALDMIASSETSVTFTMKTNYLNKDVLKSFKTIANLTTTNNLVKISVIGQNMSNSDIIEKIFSPLKEKKIQPLMISMGGSKNNIGIIVENKNKSLAVESIHKNLFK